VTDVIEGGEAGMIVAVTSDSAGSAGAGGRLFPRQEVERRVKRVMIIPRIKRKGLNIGFLPFKGLTL
jgi:hypothetical protein